MENSVDLYLTNGNAASLAKPPVPEEVQTLKELSRVLDSIEEGSEPGLSNRLQVIGQIERSAGEALQALVNEYIGAEHAGNSAGQGQIADVATAFLDLLCRAFEALIRQIQTYEPGWREVRENTPLLLASLLRALSNRLKWQLLRYRPVDKAFWGSLAWIWSYAEDRGFDTSRIALSDGEQTTLQREFLKPLMLAVSSVETLPPEEVEIVERISSWLSPLFELHRHPAKGCHFFIDVDLGSAPARFFAGTRISGGQRFFGPAVALEKLDAAAAAIADQGKPPDMLDLEVFDLEQVVEVFGHLSVHWGARRPGRREERKRSVALIGVVPGFDELVTRIGAERVVDLAKDARAEIWKIENESESGYGAVLPFDQSNWVRVGSVMGMRAADSRMWSIGIVRRLAARDDKFRYVGIQLLARGARVVLIQIEGDPDGEKKAVLLPSHIGESVSHGEVSLLLPAGKFSSEDPVHMVFHGQIYLLEPRMLLENGVDYDLAYYRIVQRV